MCAVQDTGRTISLTNGLHVRFSRFIRHPDETPPKPAEVPVRRWVMWALIGAAIVVGIVLYFLYARLLQPLTP